MTQLMAERTHPPADPFVRQVFPEPPAAICAHITGQHPSAIARLSLVERERDFSLFCRRPGHGVLSADPGEKRIRNFISGLLGAFAHLRLFAAHFGFARPGVMHPVDATSPTVPEVSLDDGIRGRLADATRRLEAELVHAVLEEAGPEPDERTVIVAHSDAASNVWVENRAGLMRPLEKPLFLRRWIAEMGPWMVEVTSLEIAFVCPRPSAHLRLSLAKTPSF